MQCAARLRSAVCARCWARIWPGAPRAMSSAASRDLSHEVLKSRDDMGNGVDAAVRGAGAARLAISRVAAWDSAHGGTNLATHGTINLATPPQFSHQKGLLENKRGMDNGVNTTVMEEAATKLKNTFVDKVLESAAAIRPTYGLHHLEHSGKHVQHGPCSILTRSRSVLQPNDEGPTCYMTKVHLLAEILESPIFSDLM